MFVIFNERAQFVGCQYCGNGYLLLRTADTKAADN